MLGHGWTIVTLYAYGLVRVTGGGAWRGTLLTPVKHQSYPQVMHISTITALWGLHYLFACAILITGKTDDTSQPPSTIEATGYSQLDDRQHYTLTIRQSNRLEYAIT